VPAVHESAVRAIRRVLRGLERRLDVAPEDRSPRVPTGGSVVSAFGDRSLAELMADTSPVSIRDPQLAWLNLPSPDFTSWVMEREPEIWRHIPATVDHFGAPTFSQVQAHRLWLTVELIRSHLPAGDATVVDIGSFPFSVPVALRQFLGSTGRIVATINQAVDHDVRRPLDELGVEIVPVNLDPLVAVSTFLDGMTDDIPVPSCSADVVVLSHVVEHLYHPMHAMRELARVLRPGGVAIVTTDNAFMWTGLVNQLTNAPFLHEPVDQTAAMLFDDWRRHVRFFTDRDLSAMLATVGLATVETVFNEVLYKSVPEVVFDAPILDLPRWRAELLTAVPTLRNDVSVVAVKPG
jgi:SAM-dependent methyltransferase